jgi:hypothetical protein
MKPTRLQRAVSAVGLAARPAAGFPEDFFLLPFSLSLHFPCCYRAVHYRTIPSGTETPAGIARGRASRSPLVGASAVNTRRGSSPTETASLSHIRSGPSSSGPPASRNSSPPPPRTTSRPRSQLSCVSVTVSYVSLPNVIEHVQFGTCGLLPYCAACASMSVRGSVLCGSAAAPGNNLVTGECFSKTFE